jgi:hypothetical protein
MATTVFRVEKNREFVVMSNKFLREKEMSLKAKGLLALCLSLPDDWEYSLNGLCAICKESQTSIRSALKELETFGYLKRERNKDEKGQFVYEYILYESPYSGFVHAGNQDAEKQDTEKAHAENVIQQSIKKQSIKKENIKEQNKEDIYISNLHNLINSFVTNEELRELYYAYIEMRQSINSPITERGMQMLITRCERMSNFNVRVQKSLLEKAIINNWKSVFHPKEEEIKNENKEVLNELKNFYGDDY